MKIEVGKLKPGHKRVNVSQVKRRPSFEIAKDFMELNLILVPLEYESSIRLKHSHTFTESLSQVILPSILIQFSITKFS